MSIPWARDAASFWSAPAERSGDGALDGFRTVVETLAGLIRSTFAESKAAWRFASRRTPKTLARSTNGPVANTASPARDGALDRSPTVVETLASYVPGESKAAWRFASRRTPKNAGTIRWPLRNRRKRKRVIPGYLSIGA
jgi:hypothetical protein